VAPRFNFDSMKIRQSFELATILLTFFKKNKKIFFLKKLPDIRKVVSLGQLMKQGRTKTPEGSEVGCAGFFHICKKIGMPFDIPVNHNLNLKND